MGRLFWKFFAFIWIAQLSVIGAMSAIAWFYPLYPHPEPPELGPPHGNRVQLAATILKYAGPGAFAQWAKTDEGHAVYAIDEAGEELLHRPVNPREQNEARENARDGSGPHWAEEVMAADSKRYLVFAAGFAVPGAAGRREWAPGVSGGFTPTQIVVGGPDRPPGPPIVMRHRGPLPFLPTLATLLASFVTALMIAWYVAKPLRILRTSFQSVATGNLTLRVAPALGDRRDEFADVARDFDRMTARIAQLIGALRRLLHDVSHEIRSPLARLQAATGLLRQPATALPALIDRIEEETARIDRLVADLLQLSRLEAGEFAEPEEELDLGELVHDAVTDANFEANLSGRSIVLKHQVSAVRRGRSFLLHRALENVLRNALKHAPASQEIEVDTAIDAARRRYLVSIADRGPGVPEQDLPKLFAPFFRSSRGAADGAGLGLSIARRSIEAHGGSIAAHNRSGGGLLVNIELPVGEPDSKAMSHAAASQ